MVRYWAVRAAPEIQEYVEKDSFAGIGWETIGDLTGLSQNVIAEKVRTIEPDAHPSKQGNVTRMLHQFSSVIEVGDIILTPIKATNRVLFGEVVSQYKYDSSADLGPRSNIREIKWLRTDVGRSELSTPMRNTMGSLLTLFSLDAHRLEIDALLQHRTPETRAEQHRIDEKHAEVVSDATNAETIESAARDRITDILYTNFDNYEFEDLVRAVLVAMGYRASGKSGPGIDGGVDIIATTDALGLNPERINVQAKHRQGASGGPDIQQLMGTLAQQERGLFVSLGGFTNEARRMRDSRVTLLDGDAFIDLLLEYYEKLGAEMQARLPLKRVYLPAGD